MKPRKATRRKDGLCRNDCGRPVPTTLGTSLKNGGRNKDMERLLLRELAKEPFCSTDCAKEFHEVKLSSPSGNSSGYGKGQHQRARGKSPAHLFGKRE